jgi:putative membrane protein insertion efficiency factor
VTRTASVLGRFVRAYQRLRGGRVTACQYVPTCSSYALEALEVHGAMRGAHLSFGRILRCHPWGGHGFDPVPDRKAS